MGMQRMQFGQHLTEKHCSIFGKADASHRVAQGVKQRG